MAVLIGLLIADEALQHQAGMRPAALLVPSVAVLLWLTCRELAAILRAGGLHASWPGMTAYSLIGFGAMVVSVSAGGAALVGGAGVLVLVIGLLSVVRKRKTQGAIGAMSAALLAFVYLGVMPGFLIVLRIEFGGWVLLGVLLVTKAYDIGAYFTGRSIGKHKLILWLSPGKTWEGLMGGLLLAGLVAAGLTVASTAGPTVLRGSAALGFVVGVLIGVVGQAGDLFASVLKRDAGVKDSSDMIPGFGGVLDMFDSALLVVPVAYWLLVWIDGI